MITVHHLENSRSQRILWLLEELGVDYEVRRYERDKKTNRAPPELLQVHPLGKSPVITHGDQTIAESGLVVEYLVEKFDTGRLAPSRDSAEGLQLRYWLHYAEGTLMPFLVISLILNRIEAAPVPFFVRPIAKGIAAKARDAYSGPNIKRNLDYLENHLAETGWFCGNDFSAADIMLSFPLETAAARIGFSAEHRNLRAFLEKIKARPAYRRALERGGPYDY